MPDVIQKKPEGKGARAAVVVSRFNDFITEKLLDAAVETLKAHGVADEAISVYWVPGAFEIPMLAGKLAATGRYDLLVCLGCVIRGGTSHYEHVCNESIGGVMEMARQSGIATGTGIVTTDNVEQALARSGGKLGNKGAEAALAALEMRALYRGLMG